MGYIELVCWVDCVVVVLVIVDLLVCLVYGYVDDLVIMLCLVIIVLLMVCLVMNYWMWQYLVIQVNIGLLCECGVQVIGLEDGLLVEGEFGLGWLSEVYVIVVVLVQVQVFVVVDLEIVGLKGLCVLISVGLIYEDLDLVCYVGNCSSGKMGYVFVVVVVCFGVQVVLVSGLVYLVMLLGVQCVDVCLVVQMCEVVLGVLLVDIYIGVVVVFDYILCQVVLQKLKKIVGIQMLMLELVCMLDILVEVVVQINVFKLVVGFVVEIYDVEKYVCGKFVDKCLDLVIVNQVGISNGGFESDENVVIVYWQGGEQVFFGIFKVWLVE